MKGGIMYKQKDIILIPFPYSDLTGAKQRPALIISNEKINKTQDRICCLVTSKSSKDSMIMDNNCFEEGTLPFKSWAKQYRLFTIHEKIIKKKLCTVSNDFYDKILGAINKCIER